MINYATLAPLCVNGRSRPPGGCGACQIFGVTDLGVGYLGPAERRPSKVISKAFRAAFHRLVQRARPRPVGSRLIVVRYRHFRAACSVGKWPRAFTARR